MSIQDIRGPETIAECDGTTLVLEHFIEDDPAVLRVLRDVDDVAEGAHTCMQVGARALLTGHAALDEVMVGRSFEQLSERLNSSVNANVDRLAESAEALLNEEDGALTTVLVDLRTDLSNRLGALFDPDSRTSALALLEETFNGASARAAAALQASLALDDADSPLGRWRTEMSKDVREQADGILKEVRDLATTIAVDAARAEVFEKTTLKGVVYEDTVHLAFAEVAAHHGDIVDDVSRARGSSGSMVGDLVVTLNPEESGGTVVLEVKAKKMGLRKTLAELEAAMANREADVGLAVFSSTETAPPGHSVFVPHGRMAVLVLDADAPDLGAVELAMAWTKWVVKRSIEADPSAFDAQRFGEALSAATRALERAGTIRKCHSTVRRQVDLAGEELTHLVAEAGEAIAEIRELAGG